MHMAAVLGLLVLATIANVWHEKAGIAVLAGGGRQATWAITIILMAAALAIAGHSARKRWDGVFIDERNRISLSRFQIILWTLLLVSALFTAGLTNIMGTAPSASPLAIDIPPEVWALLGLGSFTAVASPALVKREEQHAFRSPASPDLLVGAVKHERNLTDPGVFVGRVYHNAAPADARWIDLIHGDLEGIRHVDIAKVQQLAFTVLLVTIYAGGLWSVMGPTSGPFANIQRFPAVDAGFVALLGISHAAYLASKPVAGVAAP